MQNTVKKVWDSLKPILTGDRIFARLFASWFLFVLTVYSKTDIFTDLSFGQDISIIMAALKVIMYFIILTVPAVLFEKYHTDSWFLFFAVSLCTLRWICKFNNDENQAFLFALAIIAVDSLISVYCIRSNKDLIAKWKPQNKTTLVFAIICFVGCAFVIALLTCLRYKTYSSPTYDFGIFCNMYYYMRKTGLPMTTCERDYLLSHFAVHISPVYYLLLPFYFIAPHPMTLQISQAIILASGVFPVMLLCRNAKISPKLTMIISLIYVTYPAITCGTFLDFHENCFLLPFLLWMFYFFERNKLVPMYVFAILSLCVKEDSAVYVLLFALYAFISRKKYISGISLAAISAIWFVVTSYQLKKYGLGVMTNRYDNLIFNSEDGLLGAIKTIAVNPGFVLTQLFTDKDGDFAKVMYFAEMILPLGFLPFCAKKPSRWLLVMPILINIMTYYLYQYSINFHYNYGITAFLIYAVIVNVPDLKPGSKRTLLTVGAVAACCLYLVTATPKTLSYVRNYKNNKATISQIDEILDTIPDDASVCASTMFVPHLADRKEIYEDFYHGGKPDIDYVILDMRPGYEKQSTGFMLEFVDEGYEITEEYEDVLTILQKP